MLSDRLSSRRVLFPIALALAMALGTATLWALAPRYQVAHAAGITVDTTGDVVDAAGGVCANITIASLPGPDGVTSLREAIRAANNTTGADTVSLPAGVYTLIIPGVDEDANATGDLNIIDGAGAATTIIDADTLDRVFDIHM